MKESIEVRIGQYLAGEMGEQEKAEFQAELASNPALNEALSEYQRIWHIKPAVASDRWDDHSAWALFEKNNIASTTKKRSIGTLAYWAMAASIVVLLGLTFFYVSRPSPKTYLYSDARSSLLELPDGSKIHLNKGSGITVFPFTHKNRHVELTGEAFFEVSPDAKRPFIISCGKTETEVVGTSFNIREWKTEIFLFVNSGKVIFRSSQDEEKALALKSGEAAVFQDNQMQMVPNPSPNAISWHNHQLQFKKGISFAEAMQDVSTYFDKVINIENDNIKDCDASISLPIKNPEIESVLTLISKTVGATVSRTGDMYTIKGGSCK